jgi:DNA modification methylase
LVDLTTTHRAVIGDAFTHSAKERFPLTICDCPYGGILKSRWDVAEYDRWMALCAARSTPDATICMWGGIGKRGQRPFFAFAATVEQKFPEWTIANVITWKKRRGYGVQRNYLFTREECLILTRGTPAFHIPYLAQERGYEGYNKKYPARSKFLRRSNVWADITEILRGKTHPAQKPDALYQVLIETHSNVGDTVFDPCAGSGTTARAAQACGRSSYLIEMGAA